MAREYVVVCALPYSLSIEAEFHVSLFLSPTIESVGETQLQNWELFPNWGEAATSLRAELFDQLGTIECAPRLEPIDPRLWRATFPGELRVRQSEVPDWSARKWSSFSARRVHDIALATHMATILSDPANPPSPSAHPLSEEIMDLARQWRCFGWRGSDRQGRMRYDESRATEQLDALIESRESLQVIERQIAGKPWLERMAFELHRCRRFYERPEAQWEYKRDPVEGAKPPDFPDNEPEFHARCALLGDHPELLRRLGLVIDLVVDRDRLRRSKWLSATLFVGDGQLVGRSTRVRCKASGDVFTTVARTPDWSDGALRLGDPNRFSVLTLDTDGSALKADRFLWTLPRLIAVQQNGDPVDAATPAQRSPGFTVAGTGQAIRVQGDLTRQGGIAGDLASGNVPTLDTEDVARGVRVEVWDDGGREWHSLHQRLSSAHVNGYGKVYQDHAEAGFIQGTTAHENFRSDQAPVQIHEALFGWEGWSLSAPRPGKRIWEKDGQPALLEAEEAPPPEAPYYFTNRVEPGSLPRLRYGRVYAFRAWATDLAGNSRPHAMNAATPDPGSLPSLDQGAPDQAPPDNHVASKLMSAARAAVTRRAASGLQSEAKSLSTETAEQVLAPEIVAHLRMRRSTQADGGSLVEGANRMARLSTAVSDALSSESLASWSPSVRPNPRDWAAVVGSQVGGLSPGAGAESAAVKKALETVTKPTPFLRWEPVSSPAVVPRWRYTEGESLRVLAIRSGVTQDPATLEISVEEPEDFVATATAIVPQCGYRSTSERHLAPPKVTQVHAELHGMFDLAVGSTVAARQRKMLGWALRADGTFADRVRADIDNPPATVPQPGMSIVHVGQPTTNLRTLPPAPGDPPPPAGEVTLGPGDSPSPGQTIIHDVDELALPYLPDPMAQGVAIHFPQAGLNWGLPFPYAAEGFTMTYSGDWPELEPFRLVLEGAASLASKVDGRVVRMMLPPGDIQLLRVSSALPKDKLALMGPWHFLPEAVRKQPEVAEAAADGMLWGLSPFEQITLVHAVNRPIEAPRPVRIVPVRALGSTSATLSGAIDLHGPSTGTLGAEAEWEEPFDDPTLPECIVRKSAAKAFETTILPYEDIALLGASDQSLTLPDIGPVNVHRAVHEFSDTRHRKVDYRFRAFTRFREFFNPAMLVDAAGNPTDELHSVVGPLLRLSVPSSAPPAPPLVHSVLPMFRWSDETESEQPMARRRSRRAGLRIYLERPWYSSGDGELLGVLIATSGDDRHYPDPGDQSGFPFVSKWGADPIWEAREVERRALPMLRLDDLLRLAALDDRTEAARPIVQPKQLPLAGIAGEPIVTVLGYKPQFNKERRLWFVDVAIDPGPQFWPFLRLAVSRYQPDSIDGCHLSPPVQCDFVQLPPERTASVSRTDDRHVRVLVSGPVGSRGRAARDSGGQDRVARIDQSRRLVARLQRRDPEIASDLGWKTVTVEKLALRGFSPDGNNASWVAELDAKQTISLIKPGLSDSDWRVAIEEWELIDADPLTISVIGRRRSIPQKERRLVYADNLAL